LLDPGESADRRESCLRTAYGLFCRHGVHAIGIDRIVAEAGVAKMTLYRHFRSKEELAIATLERREALWTIGWLIPETERRGATPAERLIAIFDTLDEWFRRADYEGCFFTNTLLETRDPTSPVGRRAVLGIQSVRDFVRSLAEEARIRDSAGFADQWYVLMSGAYVLASSGDVDAARRARAVGVLVLEQQQAATSGSGARSSG
jgi:AcrR family transcriptional regulator